jgi:hypothetical protein
MDVARLSSLQATSHPGMFVWKEYRAMSGPRIDDGKPERPLRLRKAKGPRKRKTLQGKYAAEYKRAAVRLKKAMKKDLAAVKKRLLAEQPPWDQSAKLRAFWTPERRAAMAEKGRIGAQLHKEFGHNYWMGTPEVRASPLWEAWTAKLPLG